MKLKSVAIKLAKILRIYFIICLCGGIITSFFTHVQLSVLFLFILFAILLIVMMTMLLNHFAKEEKR